MKTWGKFRVSFCLCYYWHLLVTAQDNPSQQVSVPSHSSPGATQTMQVPGAVERSGVPLSQVRPSQQSSPPSVHSASGSTQTLHLPPPDARSSEPLSQVRASGSVQHSEVSVQSAPDAAHVGSVVVDSAVVGSAVVGSVVWALVVESVVIEASHVLDPRLQIGVGSVQSAFSQHSTSVLEVSHLYSHVFVSGLQMSSPEQSSSSEHSGVMHVPSSQMSPELRQSSSTVHSGGIVVVVESVVFESYVKKYNMNMNMNIQKQIARTCRF